MVVMILERAAPSLRGELTRWMLEPQAGVFVGSLSAVVRDKLWERACSKANGAGCMLIYSTNTEQGFAFRFWGRTNREVADFDGLSLICVPKNR